jgi:hypothetical protein
LNEEAFLKSHFCGCELRYLKIIPFASASFGLLDTPKNLQQRGFRIIHGVKDYNGQSETDIRASSKPQGRSSVE